MGQKCSQILCQAAPETGSKVTQGSCRRLGTDMRQVCNRVSSLPGHCKYRSTPAPTRQGKLRAHEWDTRTRAPRLAGKWSRKGKHCQFGFPAIAEPAVLLGALQTRPLCCSAGPGQRCAPWAPASPQLLCLAKSALTSPQSRQPRAPHLALPQRAAFQP